MGRHVSQRRCAAAARVRGPHRAQRCVHHRGPGRRRRPDGLGSAAIGLERDAQALSAQGDLPGHLLAHGQQPNHAARPARRALPVVRGVGDRTGAALQCLCGREAKAAGPRLRRLAAVLVSHGVGTHSGTTRRWSVRSRVGGRVPRHQSAASRDPARHEARRSRTHGGRRRRAIDLFVPCGRRAQHPRFSGSLHTTCAYRQAGAQLSVDSTDPRRVERVDCRGEAALC